MRVRKLIQRLRGNVPLFPAIPLVPIAIVVSDAVFAVLNFRRLKRLEARINRPILANGRAAKVARAHA
jgi:hypothetical protein